MARWTDSRLALALRLLAILPRRPGVGLAELLEDLGCTERTLYRLLVAVREAGINVHASCAPDGRRLYWVSSAELVERILSA